MEEEKQMRESGQAEEEEPARADGQAGEEEPVRADGQAEEEEPVSASGQAEEKEPAGKCTGKDLLGSFVIACSMYSRIPMPRIQWTGGRMKYAMCFFPAVGVFMGILLSLFGWLVRWFGIPEGSIFFAAGGTLLPILVTGGIHMDGYLDVTDAKASYGEREKKLEILKDPHVGAFAVIGCGVYLLCYLAVFSLVRTEQFALVGAVYVLTRAMSGLAVVSFPLAKKSGLAAAFSDGAQKRTVKVWMAVDLAACFGFLFWRGGMALGACCCLVSIWVFRYYRRMAVREFGGITGDLAGYFLQLAELALVAVLAIF